MRALPTRLVSIWIRWFLSAQIGAKSPWTRFVPRMWELVAGAAVFLAVFIGLVVVIRQAGWSETTPRTDSHSVAAIGESLLTTYLVPFEVTSVLLLAVMIGAAFLSRPERKQ